MDSAGNEKYKCLIPLYIGNASSILIVYDVTSKTSFDNVSKWISFIKTIENCKNCNIILCANKIDLESERQVTTEAGKDLAKKNKLIYYEVSAKNNIFIIKMFYSVVADLSIVGEEKGKEGLIKQLEEENEEKIEIKDMPKIKYEKDNFYDVIIKINLLNELLIDGWEIISSKNYEDNKNFPLVPIGVIGQYNSGKSFMLGKIFNIDLPEGYSEETEGISVKYLNDFWRVALIDSAGLRKSIAKNYKNEKILKKLFKESLIKKEEEKKMKKNLNEINENEINIEDIKINNENLFYECFNKIISDKQITEQLIIDFVLKKSRIILIVVGQMTTSEQLLINHIKEINKDNENYENKEIIIIHNLFNFIKIKQVEDYIKNVLKKSIYFNLEERLIVDNDEINKDFNNKYFIERYYKEDTKKTNVIRHLIFANDSKESEAGNYYNYSTIQFIRNIILGLSYQKTFDVIQEFKEFLIQESFKYFHLNEEQKKESKLHDYLILPINEKNLIIEEIKKENNNKIQIENEIKKSYLIKINSNLQIKEFHSDFKNLGNEFTPPFRYYREFVDKKFLKKDNKSENKIEVLVIEIDLAGKIKDFRPKISQKYGKYYVLITGIKELPKNNDMLYLFSNIEENEFRIEFEINMNELELLSNKLIKNTTKDGIIKLYYEIKSSEKYDDEIEIRSNLKSISKVKKLHKEKKNKK